MGKERKRPKKYTAKWPLNDVVFCTNVLGSATLFFRYPQFRQELSCLLSQRVNKYNISAVWLIEAAIIHLANSLSSSEFLLGSTVRGLCRPEDRSNKINQRQGFELVKQALICYSAISPRPLLYAVAN